MRSPACRRLSILSEEFVSDGLISTEVAQKLLDDPSKTVADLETERRDDATMVAEWKLIDTLSSAHLDIPGGGQQSLGFAEQDQKIATELGKRRPDDKSYRHDLSVSDMRIGDALQAKGDFDNALNAYGAAKALLDSLIGPAHPTRTIAGIYPTSTREWATISMPKTTSAARSLSTREFLDIAQDLSQRADAKPDWLRGLAIAHERMGDALRNLDEPQQALDHYTAYQQAAQNLIAKESPGSPNYKWRLDLLISYERIGWILLAQRKFDKSLQSYKTYLSGTEKIADTNPTEGLWQRFLANGYIGEGDVLLAQGETDNALAMYGRASQIYTRLVAGDKFRDSWREISRSLMSASAKR